MLTVMMTSYNQNDILFKNIDNMIEQYQNVDFKLLISDDFSQHDQYQKLLDKCAPYDFIKVIQPAYKKAVGCNRNNLLKNIETDYAIFVDGDDIQYLNFVEKINDALKSQKMVYHLKGFEEITPHSIKKKNTCDYENIYLYVFNKQLCELVRFDEDLVIGEDYHFSIKYYDLLYFDFEEIDIYYKYYRFFNSDSLSSIKTAKKRFVQESALLDRIIEFDKTSDYVTRRVNEKKIDVLNYSILSDRFLEPKYINFSNMRVKYILFHLFYKVAIKVRIIKVYGWIFEQRIYGKFNFTRLRGKKND